MGLIAFNKCFFVEFSKNNQSNNAKYKILSYYVLMYKSVKEVK
ncbi:TPA: hypothetical protein PD194_000149 [Staphylococcus aureus]|nr:hypothetical protein [Staphylococcus aureus]HDE8308312.1 hypothetical protein [Staphylococcus aureus]HDF0006428.1 hypothetical protein [Staphylococcus aureus]HDF0702586.1 hypothetical protein [Staphylococcus aureus]HDF0916447.1 hypothetical protein [Staphylococcus aureus]